uniref:Homing endonuclease LAGLIDADG domain-containing protein n=1 Tax=Torulaspora globosa TaxID=48254 RepID=A0A0H3V226_9SACH|nr:hypothetical protein [Torulaspora globosa]AJG03037.1 hypothetical protein [Torulaspora globosa]
MKMMKNNLNKTFWWLVGFTDGDGSFTCYTSKVNKIMSFKLNYHLHKDDLICLNNIKNMLNYSTNIYFEKDNTARLMISNHKFLLETIIPIFDKYPCLTIKHYSYLKWKESLLYYTSKNKENWLLNSEKNKLINNYKLIDNIDIPYELMNINWLIGFIEAEGHLNFYPGNKSNITVRSFLTITQHERSLNTLKAIKNFMNTWTYSNNTPLPIKLFLDEKLNIHDNWVFLSKMSKLNAYTLAINNMDMLYYIVLPKLEAEQWYSRKKDDFIMWKTALTIIIKGLHNTNEGMNLLNILYNNMNKKRYNKQYDIPYEMINKVINMTPIYCPYLPYEINTTIKVKKSGGVYMYDLKGNLFKVFKGASTAGLFFNMKRHQVLSYINKNMIINNNYILKDYNYFIKNYKNNIKK